MLLVSCLSSWTREITADLRNLEFAQKSKNILILNKPYLSYIARFLISKYLLNSNIIGSMWVLIFWQLHTAFAICCVDDVFNITQNSVYKWFANKIFERHILSSKNYTLFFTKISKFCRGSLFLIFWLLQPRFDLNLFLFLWAVWTDEISKQKDKALKNNADRLYFDHEEISVHLLKTKKKVLTLH